MAIDFKNSHTFDPHLQESMMSGPIPGQSFTHEYKSMPWQHPSKHTDLESTMNHLFGQLLEPEHLKQLLQLMEGGMSIEAITRTILFIGFSTGQFNPDLGILLYKPLMLSLIAIAHRAGIKDTPIVMKESLDKHIMDRMKRHVMVRNLKKENIGMESLPISKALPEVPEASTPPAGFMSKGQ